MLFGLEERVEDLEKAFRTHLDTTAPLFAHVVALKMDARLVTLTPPNVARLLQRLQLDHERANAVLVAIRRVVLEGPPPERGARNARDLDGTLTVCEQRAEERFRLEREVLVPRVLELDVSVVRDARAVTLDVHRLDIVSSVGRRETLSVLCPAERCSFTTDWCGACPLVREVHESSVCCTPHATSRLRAHASACDAGKGYRWVKS